MRTIVQMMAIPPTTELATMTAMSVAPCNPDEEEDELEAAAVALLEGEDEESLVPELLGTDIAAIEEVAALVVAAGVDLGVVAGVGVASTTPETTVPAPAVNEFNKPPITPAGVGLAAGGVVATLVGVTGAVVAAAAVGCAPPAGVTGVLAAALAGTASAVPLFAAPTGARTTSSILLWRGRGVS